VNRVALALAATFSTAVLAACGNSSDTAPGGGTDLGAAARASLEQASPGLISATDDVNRITPKLEQYYFAKGYPRDLAGAKASLKPAGQKVADGNTVDGYSFDDKAAEFILCIQNKSGAWATYDTAPMEAGATGESGGCPADLRGGHGGGHTGH
jgi:hypothetical protein